MLCFGCTTHAESAHLSYEKLQVPPGRCGPIDFSKLLSCFAPKMRRLHTSPSIFQDIAHFTLFARTILQRVQLGQDCLPLGLSSKFSKMLCNKLRHLRLCKLKAQRGILTTEPTLMEDRGMPLLLICMVVGFEHSRFLPASDLHLSHHHHISM